MRTTRRGFLGGGAAALAGTIVSGAGIRSVAAAELKTSRSGGTAPEGKMIGCYTNSKEVLENPKYIDALQKKLGVNTLLCGEGIRMPQWLRDMNPLHSTTMFASHKEDDSSLVKAIEETHRRGMRFWLYFSGHHNSGEEREVMSETFEGIKFADLPPIPYALSQGEMTTCFEKPRVKNYVRELFTYAPNNYPVDGMYVSHTRYATPSFWTNLFGCACPDCRAAAGSMGYDFEKMSAAMTGLRRKLRRLDRKTLEHAARFRLTFADFLSELGEDNGVSDWLYFRARVVGNALRRMHDAVHAVTDDRATFVTDTHNSTMALWVGHNYEDLIGGASDGLHPLSWCAYQHISVLSAWANQLCEWVPGLDESTALRVVTSFFGWDELGLPDTKIADLHIGKSSAETAIYSDPTKGFYGFFNTGLTEKLMTHEWTRMAAINRGRIPAHPVIKGFEWPEKVCRELMARTEELGLNGYVFQRTENLIDREKL